VARGPVCNSKLADVPLTSPLQKEKERERRRDRERRREKERETEEEREKAENSAAVRNIHGIWNTHRCALSIDLSLRPRHRNSPVYRRDP